MPHPGRRRAPGLAVVAALCGLGLAQAPPSLAGSVLRGRVLMPSSVPAKNAQGAWIREALSPADVVIYVTEPPGAKGPSLSGRARRKDVELTGDRFTPRVIPVTVGSRVRFRNRDHVYHGVLGIAVSGRTDLGSLAPGASREARFDRPGVVNLFCQLHPAAAGFVIVCPNWFHTRAAESGEYALPPLPRGTFVVHAWHPRLGESRRTVAVTGRDALKLDLGF